MSVLMSKIVAGLFVAWVGGFVLGSLFRVIQDIFNAITSNESE